MTTVMYQGLQSCFETQLVESRTLRLKLASPKPNFSQPIELAFKSSSSSSSFFDSSNPKELKEECRSDKTSTVNSSSSNPKTGGWSFIQSLSSTTYNPKQNIEKENTYVHPLVKHSSKSSLSGISLELCTESLGSETGTDSITDNSIFSITCWENENGKYPVKEHRSKPREVLATKKTSARSFPPALTTMRGSEFLQFRPHREDGRLVIKAVKTPLQKTLFHVERGDGRLRLSFLNRDSDSEIFNDGEANEGKCEIELGSDGEEEEMEEENHVLLREDTNINGNTKDDEVKTGIENYARMHSRCKEDGHGNNESLLLSNLKPLLLATS